MKWQSEICNDTNLFMVFAPISFLTSPSSPPHTHTKLPALLQLSAQARLSKAVTAWLHFKQYVRNPVDWAVHQEATIPKQQAHTEATSTSSTSKTWQSILTWVYYPARRTQGCFCWLIKRDVRHCIHTCTCTYVSTIHKATHQLWLKIMSLRPQSTDVFRIRCTIVTLQCKWKHQDDYVPIRAYRIPWTPMYCNIHNKSFLLSLYCSTILVILLKSFFL